MTTAKRVVSVAGAMLLLTSGVAFGQAQSKNQQGCVNALNKDGAKVGATQGKENTGCIKSAGKSGGSGAQACLTADSKGKVAKAASKIQADFDKKCTTETPTTGVPGVFSGTAAAVAKAGQDDEIGFVADVFGSPLDNAILTDKAGSKCQATVSKDSEKTFATYMKGFLKCKKGALKAGSSLDACVLDDPGGKAASTVGKLAADIGKKCADIPSSTYAPGLCAGASDVAACIGERVACRACRMQNAMDGLHVNCDALDDGDENGSCAAGRANECVLADTSSIELSTSLGPLSLTSSGSVDIAIGGSTGINPASCGVIELAPLDLVGVGFICLNPGSGCDVGQVDCDGGSASGIALSADRNIGNCTDNDDCLSQCEAFCGGGSNVAIQGLCEGFCSGTNPPNQACLLDADCIDNGACSGQDGVPAGPICECQCLASITNISPPGAINCNFGVDITVETAAPCDGADVLISVGTACIPLTTTNAVGTINNANNNTGTTLGPFIGNGSSVSCFEQDANITSGMGLRGSVAFFASTIGDILSGTVIDCL